MVKLMQKTEDISETTDPQCDGSDGVDEYKDLTDSECIKVLRCLGTECLTSEQVDEHLAIPIRSDMEKQDATIRELKAELKEMQSRFDTACKAYCDRIRRLLQEKRDAKH